ncbi:16135_t:CDS:2, partial [Acaulospora morrowiae]
IHCNPETVNIDVRHAESNEVKKIQLFEYLSSKCPSLVGEHARYYPTPWIGNGHAQTLYASKLVKTPDGGQIAVDWTPPMSQKPIDDTPTVVVLHGLTGGSHESYIRCLLEVLTNPPHNYRAVVINFRGCSESHITSPKLYSAASTNDLRTVLRYIQEIIPDSSLIAIGFSMGANILVKYLGEEGDKTPLIAAASV